MQELRHVFTDARSNVWTLLSSLIEDCWIVAFILAWVFETHLFYFKQLLFLKAQSKNPR